MSARSVSTRFGCLLFGAALSINAQFADDHYRRSSLTPGIGTSPLMVDGTVPDIGNDRQENPAGSEQTISIKRLDHKVPGKAAKEYRKGVSLRAKHKFEEALAHLRTALELDPEFVEAANDVGAVLADLNRSAEAQVAFEKTIKIDPQYWSGYFNLAVIYMVRGHFADAERAARTALDLNRAGAGSRAVLGMSLVLQDKFTDEAINLLEDTREQYPQSHLFLARALAGRGKNESAQTEIQLFLRTPEAKDQSARVLAESWLQALTNRK